MLLTEFKSKDVWHDGTEVLGSKNGEVRFLAVGNCVAGRVAAKLHPE
jgi:hypothetical protein